MTLIGTTPLTRYPRLHPDMGYLRTILSPAMNPMTLNDLPICQFPSCLMAGHDKQFIFVRRGKFCLAGQLPVTVGSRCIVPSARCALTNATHPPTRTISR